MTMQDYKINQATSRKRRKIWKNLS